MLASVAQLHKNHAEAVHLFRIVAAEYEVQGMGSVERAELFNSLGESLLEVRHYAAAAPIFKQAKEMIENADDVEEYSVASIEANEARLLSETGKVDAAVALFEKAKATTTAATELALQRSVPDHSHLMMVHMLHARVIQLYSAHCIKHGSAKEGEAMAQVVKGLEARYGFSSQ